MKTQDRQTPSWLKTAVFYQIYPQSFLDTNGDGIGDLPGIIEKLGYIRSLGCNAIWLNPVFASPFKDGGYDVSDYCRVAPRYGTNRDLKRLFHEAHCRGMRVVLDLVAGHTSDQHPWFKQSAQVRRSRYSDYYIWTDSVWETLIEPGLLPGHERDGCYLPNFFPCQPALNYGYAKPDPKKRWQQPMNSSGPRAVLKELRRVISFWLDAGCDGFRVDMASSLVKRDPDGRGIRHLWIEVRTWLDDVYPEAVLVSEWSNPIAAISAGFHIDFMIHFGEPAYQYLCAPEVSPRPNKVFGYFNQHGGGDILPFLDNYLHHYRRTRKHGYIALPTGNHDFARFRYRRSEEELRVFLALLLTLPGVPFVYYGDEIGLEYRCGLATKEGGYSRTGTRTPMQWTTGKNRGFSSAPAGRLYLPVNNSRGQDVQTQDDDPNSVLNLTRKLLELRRNHAALGNDGVFAPLHAKRGKHPFVYLRQNGREQVVVAINPCNEECSLQLPLLNGAKTLLSWRASVAGQRLRMAGVSFAIFSLAKERV